MSSAIELAKQLFDELESKGHKTTTDSGCKYISVWQFGNQIEIDCNAKTVESGTV